MRFSSTFCLVTIITVLFDVTVSDLRDLPESVPLAKCAESKRSLLLWSVESPRQKLKSFLFGTIHVSYDEVWGYVSERVKEAFAEAESVVFELQLQNAETVEQLLQCKNLDGDETVRDRLPSHLYDRLKLYMRRFKYKLLHWVYRTRQLPKVQAKREAKRLYLSIAGDWELKRPVWLLFLLYQMSESSVSTDAASATAEPAIDSVTAAPMLDAFLAHRAQELGKQLRAIETPLEQCNPLASVGEAQVIFAINYTLAYLEWAETKAEDHQVPRRDGLAELVSHYRCGSLEASVFNARRFAHAGFTLTPELDARARDVDALLVDDIVLKRNLRMASRADALIRQSPHTSFFFAIGAGHFLGDESLIKALEKYNYVISPVSETDDIIGYFRSNNVTALRSHRFNELWVRDGSRENATAIPLPHSQPQPQTQPPPHPLPQLQHHPLPARLDTWRKPPHRHRVHSKHVPFAEKPRDIVEVTVELVEMANSADSYERATGGERSGTSTMVPVAQFFILFVVLTLNFIAPNILSFI